MIWFLAVCLVCALAFTARQVRVVLWRRRLAGRLLFTEGQAFTEQAYALTVTEESAETPAGLQWLNHLNRRAAIPAPGVLLLLIMISTASLATLVVYSFIHETFWAGGAALICGYVPLALVQYAGGVRIRRLEGQLADTISAIAGALQSGLGLRQALELSAANARQPLRGVMEEVLAQAGLGMPLAYAFRSVAHELRSGHFNSFTMTVATSYEAGGNLVSMLNGLGRRIGEGVRLRRRVSSLTAEARFSALILYVMPYALAAFIWWRTPETLEFLYAHPMGNFMIRVCIVLQIIGLFWIASLLRVNED